MEKITKSVDEPIPMVLELFGHTKMAGMVSEYQKFGSSFVRVDVPETNFSAAFSKILHPNAVYAFNPVDRETMLAMAQRLHVMPLDPFEIQPVIEALQEKEKRRQIALMERSEARDKDDILEEADGQRDWEQDDLQDEDLDENRQTYYPENGEYLP